MRRVAWAVVRFAALPVILLGIAITATVMAVRANRAASPPTVAEALAPQPAETPILSARRVPQWLLDPVADMLFQEAIEAAIREAPENSCVVVRRNGDSIVERNIDSPMRPGDLQRLVTLAALADLGNSGFRTEVAMRTDSEVTQDGVLVGDLWLIGGGDPVLSSRSFAERLAQHETVFSDFDALAEDTISALRKLGVSSISGAVIGDEQKYTPVELDYVGVEVISIAGEQGEIWTADQVFAEGVGPLSGLLLNNGLVAWDTDLIGDDVGGEAFTADPASAAAQALHDRIERYGIDIDNPPGAGVAPSFAERRALAFVDSPPLFDIMARALDDTTTAEMLLKEIGIRQGQTSERGPALWGLITGGFEAAGLPYVLEGPVEYHDGSGLSDFNRSTCEMQLATVVDADGTVSRLLEERADSPELTCGIAAEGDLRLFIAVGDTTSGMVGRYEATDGDRFTFALMAEDPGRMIGSRGTEAPGSQELCSSAIIAMLDAITGYPHGPTIEALSPSPATGS